MLQIINVFIIGGLYFIIVKMLGTVSNKKNGFYHSDFSKNDIRNY